MMMRIKIKKEPGESLTRKSALTLSSCRLKKSRGKKSTSFRSCSVFILSHPAPSPPDHAHVAIETADVTEREQLLSFKFHKTESQLRNEVRRGRVTEVTLMMMMMMIKNLLFLKLPSEHCLTHSGVHLKSNQGSS